LIYNIACLWPLHQLLQGRRFIGHLVTFYKDDILLFIRMCKAGSRVSRATVIPMVSNNKMWSKRLEMCSLAWVDRMWQVGRGKEKCDPNPFAPTRRKTVTHIRWFFTVLEYSPIGVKFPPITAPRTLYTEKKKNWKIFKTFLVLKVWMFLINFDEKTCFLNSFKIYIVINFSVFTIET
jgi:hypothetical protein